MEKLEISDTTVNLDKTARTESLVTGATLMFNGLSTLKKQPTIAVIKSIIGGYLLYRAITGHCHLNQMLGQKEA